MGVSHKEIQTVETPKNNKPDDIKQNCLSA